jgi:hypothetical protein
VINVGISLMVDGDKKKPKKRYAIVGNAREPMLNKMLCDMLCRYYAYRQCNTE